jgi:hypothetical protein
VFAFLFSCDKKPEDKSEKQPQKPLLSIVKEHVRIKSVTPSFTKDIEKWEELKAVDNFISRFIKVSPNEVLSNALELKILVKSLRDSIKPTLFEIPSFNTRINILYNETLRLADMTFIPAIKAEEVNNQTDKILEAFSAVNSKVNTILSKKRFEDAIEIDVRFIGLDSTKIDSVSKKAIKNNFLKKSLKNKQPKSVLPKKRTPVNLLDTKN